MIFDGVSFEALSQCTFARWQPKIGDPNVMGWVTVGCYLATFVLCVAVYRKANRSRKKLRLFWLLLSVFMLFLAVNKQLDLQSFATAGARCVAKLQGWYENRAGFQMKVVLALGGVALATGAFFIWMLKRDLKRNLVALIGLTIVFCFILIRAVGWHDFDAVINTRIVGLRLNWVLELSGLILISINAVGLLRYSKIAHPPRKRRRIEQNDNYRRQH